MLTGSSSVAVRGQTQVLGPGALALIFPNQVHSYTALEPGTGAVLVVCDLSYTGGYADTLLRSHPEDPFLSGEKLHPNVPYAIQELEREARLQRESPVFGPLIQLVLARALPQLSLAKNSAADRRELTYQISQYVGEHFREPLTLGTLARELGMNKYHLSHVFSEKMGQSFLLLPGVSAAAGHHPPAIPQKRPLAGGVSGEGGRVAPGRFFLTNG